MDTKYIVSQAIYEAFKACSAQGHYPPKHLMPHILEAIEYLIIKGYFNENTI